jgi:hypothetical protein
MQTLQLLLGVNMSQNVLKFSHNLMMNDFGGECSSCWWRRNLSLQGGWMVGNPWHCRRITAFPVMTDLHSAISNSGFTSHLPPLSMSVARNIGNICPPLIQEA